MALLVTAEDDDDLREIMARSLRRAGHTLIATPDGGQALQAVRQHRPDAVVTDLDMPVMTGLQMCRAIREDPQVRHTPVLMVSGSMQPGDDSARDAGVTSIIGKPVAGGALVQHVADVLARPSQQRH